MINSGREWDWMDNIIKINTQYNIMEQLEKLVKEGYEDLTISKQNLIKLIENYSHNIPLLINGRKVWIHFTESDKILVECDISDGSGVELDIEEI